MALNTGNKYQFFHCFALKTHLRLNAQMGSLQFQNFELDKELSLSLKREEWERSDRNDRPSSRLFCGHSKAH